MKESPEPKHTRSRPGLGLAVGVAIGTASGVAMGNIGVGLGAGIVLGVILGKFVFTSHSPDRNAPE